jgi:hypothetical protein
VGIVRKEIDELVAEGGKRSAAANARMIVDEEDELAQRRQLVRKRLRELRETSLEPPPAIEEGHKVLAELGGVPPQRADQISEENERIFVAPLQGEPGRAVSGRAQKVGVLRESGRLPVAGGGVHEREPLTLGALQTIE